MRTLLVGMIVLVGCTPWKAELSNETSVSQEGFAILTSDFSVGELLLVWPQATTVAVPVHSDSKVVAPSQRPSDLLVVGRNRRDSLLFLDRHSGEVRAEYSLGLGSNAQDALFVTPEIVYAVRYQDNAVWMARIDGRYRMVETKSVSFHAIDTGADGNAELVTLAHHERFVLIAAQNLSDVDFRPTGNSKIVVLDVSDPWNPVELSSVRMHCQNPVTGFQIVPTGNGALIFIGGAGLMGFYSQPDGCVERLRLSGAGHIESLGVAVGESVLGGDIVDLSTQDGRSGVVMVASPANESTAFMVDFNTGSVQRRVGFFAGRVSTLLPFKDSYLFAVSDPIEPRVERRDRVGTSLPVPFKLPLDLLPPVQISALGAAR